MNKSTLSMMVFALYLAGLACAFMIFPNPVIALFGFVPTDQVWIRILGFILAVLAFFYIMACREGVRNFYRWTVYSRLTVMPAYILFIVFGVAPPVVLVFAAVDLAGALWTGFALKAES
jgi:hypothetical protein